MTQANPLWTLAELSTRVALALAMNYPGSPNGRVREVPDQRTIRYYTTLGLIDRPAEMRGRTALYGQRHLQQVVAIKRLQAHGLSLAEIQKRLLGLSPAALAEIARLPPQTVETVTSPASAESTCTRSPLQTVETAADRPELMGTTTERSEGRGETFWRESPAELSRTTEASAMDPNGTEAPAGSLQGVSLGPDVTLLLTLARPLDENDCEALRVAAAPLLTLLHTRRLLRPRHERNP